MKLQDLRPQVTEDALDTLRLDYQSSQTQSELYKITEAVLCGLSRRVYVWTYKRSRITDREENYNQALSEVYLQLPRLLARVDSGLGIIKYCSKVVHDKYINYRKKGCCISRTQAPEETSYQADLCMWETHRQTHLSELVDDIADPLCKQIVRMIDADYKRSEIARWVMANQDVSRATSYRLLDAAYNTLRELYPEYHTEADIGMDAKVSENLFTKSESEAEDINIQHMEIVT